MNTPADQRDAKASAAGPVVKRLHPRVYAILVGSAAWFVLALWSFSGAGVVDYLLFIVSGFIFVVMALMLILSRVGKGAARAKSVSGAGENPKSWKDWAASDFDAYESRLSGAEAAILILLPIATAAIGMTAIGVVFLIVEHGGV